MSPYCSQRFALALAALFLAAPGAHAQDARHRTAPWSRITLRHVSPQYVFEALNQGREWRALLHGTKGHLLEGVTSVVPSRRDSALYAQGTRAGVQQLREIVALLDGPPHVTAASPRPYEMALSQDWEQSLADAGTVLAHDSTNAAATALKAYALAKTGRPDAARSLAASALRQTEGHSGRARALALVAQGEFARRQGFMAGAVQAFQQAGSADPTLGLAYLAFADCTRASGKGAVAKQLLQAGLAEVKTPAERDALQAALESP